jgi:ribosome-binding factor A
MKQTKRTRQLADVIQRDLADIIRREVRDPGLGFVTISGVEISTDLKLARVHVSVLGSEEEQVASLGILENHRKLIRTSLASRLHTRRTPDLEFRLDHTAERAGRLEEILREVLPPASGEAAEEPQDDE